MKHCLLSLTFAFLCIFTAMAQSGGGKGKVSGVVLDNDDGTPVMQATVQVLSVKDSAMVTGNVTNSNGYFSLNAKPGKYILKVSYIGYTPYYKDISTSSNKPDINVGKVMLRSDAIMLQEAVITAEAPEVTAVEDTLVYATSAYRVPEGSALEELVKKLPGAEVDDDGKITINGKEITKIMIDGKEFFADDPNIAMKNLPVNMIDKLKAYDKQSDMARMTGIDDGEEETVLDLTVKKGMNKGFFANADAAAGTEDRYSAKVLANYFRDKNQFTVIGSMNNTNDEGFPGGGGGGRFRSNNGLTAVKTGGFNFATETAKFEAGGSFNFNWKDNDLISKQSTETFVSESSSYQNALSSTRKKTTNITADFRLEWKPDTMTNILFRPRLTYGKTDTKTNSSSYTFNDDPGYSTDEILEVDDITTLVSSEYVVNSILKNTLSQSDELTVGGSIIFNRRLGKPGRNITFRGSYQYTNSGSEQYSTSETKYYQTEDLSEEDLEEILLRYTDAPTKSYNYSARLSYTEPFIKNTFLQLSYNFQYKRNETDNNTYNMPDGWTINDSKPYDGYGEWDSDLSKSAKYDYYNHQVDFTFRWVTSKMNFNAGVSFQPQNTKLKYKKGELDTITTRNVFNFTPTLDFRYKFNKTSQLRITYRGTSSQPSMTDLLPITDDTDPLNVKVGNPDLKPTFTNTLRVFYNTFNTETQRGLMTHLNFQSVSNSISSRKVYNESTGGYTTTPMNVNGNLTAFAMLGANIALKNKKYTINTFTNVNYSKQVSFISSESAIEDGNDKNTMKNLSLGQRLRGTYRNSWIEFSLNGNLTYSHARNSYQTSNNMDTWQFAYGASTNITLPWNMTISTDLSQKSRRGYSDSSMNTNELVWNAQLAQNFLRGNAATLSLQFYDILQQQSNISRTISAATRQDTEYNAIYSYCMVKFTYRLNLFGGREARRGGFGFGGPGGPGGPGGGPGGGFGGGGRRPPE